MNISQFHSGDRKIGIIGLGYVGLPLAVLFGTKFKVVGFDINEGRINELRDNIDRTNEVTTEQLEKSTVNFTAQTEELKECSVLIVTVPTPIDEYNTPDLRPIRAASKTVASALQKGTIVVYESTVYPGVTEDECVPILEEVSGMKWKSDFNVGYSPERVNPGDKERTIDKIIKVVSGDTPETAKILDEIYSSVITAGTHLAPTIKTAEASKVIENTQRDLNIALMNELSIIFNTLGIQTSEVLKAAGTKWNFLKFHPGLVGGHCIGVDPYYLTFKAESVGYHPQVILSGRRINDKMGKYITEQMVKQLIQAGKIIQGKKVLICGLTFKENVPDIRNTKVIDIYNELKEYGVEPVIYDPMVDTEEVQHEYGITPIKKLNGEKYLGVILAVKHKVFEEELTVERCCELQEGRPVIVDVKGVLENQKIDREKILYMTL